MKGEAEANDLCWLTYYCIIHCFFIYYYLLLPGIIVISIIFFIVIILLLLLCSIISIIFFPCLPHRHLLSLRNNNTLLVRISEYFFLFITVEITTVLYDT